MTLNYNIMGENKNCKHLNVERKAKLKFDANNKILYANNYFLEITNNPIHEIILKDLDLIFHKEMPVSIQELTMTLSRIYPVQYGILKGVTKDSDCYWGFVKTTQNLNEHNEISGYTMEIKLLPNPAVSKIEKLFEVLKEIENNASVDAAKKYLNGYLEEKNMSYQDFIFNITEVNEKKAEKYFEIDSEAVSSNKKKKSWF